MAICCLARVLRTQNNRRDGMVLSRWRFLRILYISISSFGLKWLRSTFVFTAEATDARDDGKRVSVRVDSNSDSEPKPTTKFQLISIVDCRWCLARGENFVCCNSNEAEVWMRNQYTTLEEAAPEGDNCFRILRSAQYRSPGNDVIDSRPCLCVCRRCYRSEEK